MLYIFIILYNHFNPHLSNVDHMMVERHGKLGRSDSSHPGRWDSQRIEEDPGGTANSMIPWDYQHLKDMGAKI